MTRLSRLLAASLTVAGLIAANGSALAFAPKDKPDKAMKDKPAHAKKQQNISAKGLLGDKIKHNGKQKFHDHGKFAASANVQNGKIAGVEVKHADRGDVPVMKYKTTKQMGRARVGGVYYASLALAQDAYLGTTWIGYAFIDDYGEEVIYWFPYDMILDGDTGAIEYYPAEY